ncbi:pentatricopeptide repeat-containing protein At1g02060, chloroplastic [Magnolia sinica]|uniref:pentatricopeptide repeat-containing protein At1g02060, chloroplastic n=1 Tax=Magnolia sinica TaxID=86752 RepID=UPI0026583390|nr:pentatricopeptide repeat-containing protein At1g02060, chloroplastic [Magnolia sinica]
MLLLQRSLPTRLRALPYHSSAPPLTLAQPLQCKQEEEESQSKRPKSKSKAALTISRLINTVNPWSTDLESSLQPLLPTLSKTSFLQTLSLIKSPSKSLLFFRWALLNGFPPDATTFSHMLDILGRSRNLNAARNLLLSVPAPIRSDDRLFNSLIRSYGRAGLIQQSIKLFRKMKELGVARSVFSFNSLFSILLPRGRTHMVKKLYDEMQSTDGIAPDVYTFNILIRGFCLNSMVDEGFRFFKEMSKFGCSPDLITYNTLVDGLCRIGKVKIAHNLLKGMRTKSPDLKPNVITYTTIIRGYCEKRSVAEVLDVFEEMVRRGLKPNRITYNTLIQGLCDARELDKMKEILKGIMENGEFRPDTCTFNTLMNAHCNAGKLDDALKMFEKMSELEVVPDSATYSVLIRSFCERGEFERAEELFDELGEKEILLRGDGCVPLVAAYNPIFEYLCAEGKTGKAERVFRQLLKKGTQDPLSFKTLILGHCTEGTLGAGYEILVLMLRRDFVPDMETYGSLIDGFLQKGDSSFAHRTLEKMLRSEHLPKTSTFHSVLAVLIRDGCAQEAASVILIMLERRIRQNINLSTDTVIGLFRNGFKDRAFEVIGLLYDNGFSVKMEKVVGFLCQCRKFLEARELLLFCLEKHRNLDIEFYSTVVMGLCGIQRAPEAFALFYELAEKGGKPSLSCLEDLKIALESEGKLKEADFISKQIMHWHQR